MNRETTEWLLACREPAVRCLTLTDLLDLPEHDPQVELARQAICEGAWVRALLDGQQPDGGFGVHPYQKWKGAHWRLVSLVELGISPGEPHACAAAGQVLVWLTGKPHRSRIQTINGLTRRCASQEGNALAVCCRLGLAGDERVKYLAQSLAAWQWPDGGWNCDVRPDARHSSFYESLAPLWGLAEYWQATGDEYALQVAKRAAEFFLRHSLFRSERDGQVIEAEWLKLHYPLYWHYDILQAMLILSRLGPLSDERLQEPLMILGDKRQPGGFWQAESFYWWPPGKQKSNVEAVDWGRRGPNVMITLNALRVLKSAGQLEIV
jgi:hypothetical protein